MFVLGVDPGLSRCGYCVLDGASGRAGGRAGARAGGRARAVALGVLRTDAALPVPRRLAALQADVRGLLEEFGPQAVALERVTFGANVRTASGVLQAAGIVMCEAVSSGAEVVEYAPNQVKEAVTGWGRAPKAQVGQMAATLLGLTEIPGPPDAADAAAIALCHLAMAPVGRLAG